MECIICNKKIIGYGNNARPFAEGICCEDCNIKKVIPYRLKLYQAKNEMKGGNKNDGN